MGTDGQHSLVHARRRALHVNITLFVVIKTCAHCLCKNDNALLYIYPLYSPICRGMFGSDARFMS